MTGWLALRKFSSEFLLLNLPATSKPPFTPSWLSKTLAFFRAINCASRSAREPAAMSLGVGREFDKGAGPHVSDALRVKVFIPPKPFQKGFACGLGPLLLLGREGSLLYPPSSRDVAKSCTDDQFGAHEPSSRPREKESLRGLDSPADWSLVLVRRAEGMGLTPRVGEGLWPES